MNAPICVTFTGADDSIDPCELREISSEFPEVEWGILFSKRNRGSPRFPSPAWVDRLFDESLQAPEMKLCAHLCGGWVREIVIDGRFSWSYHAFRPMFDRVQLNFHAEPHGDMSGFAAVLAESPTTQFILQLDGVHDFWVGHKCDDHEGLVLPLFDTSGGAGVLPFEGLWPHSFGHHTCGYAGGLGPDNVATQLRNIAEAAGDNPFWIDMERRVRSADDKQFDLQKVRQVLELVRAEVAK